MLYGKNIPCEIFFNREAEAKLKQLLDGHGLSNNNNAVGEGGNNSRSRQGVVLGSAVTRSLEQLPASRLLAASLDNLPGSRLPPRPASAVRRQLFTKDGGEGKEARLRSRWLPKVLEFGKFLYVTRHSQVLSKKLVLVILENFQAQLLAQPDPGGGRARTSPHSIPETKARIYLLQTFFLSH